MVDTSRRRFVRKGGASILTLGAAGLAGCTSSLPSVGATGTENDEVGRWLVELPITDLLDEDWLADLSGGIEILGAEVQDREFEYVDARAVFDSEEELIAYWSLEDSTGVRNRTGVPAVELDWQLDLRTTWEFDTDSSSSVGEAAATTLRLSVLAGSFNSDGIEATLERWADSEFDGTAAESQDEAGFANDGDHEGYTLYTAGNYGFAVGDDRVVEIEADSVVETTAVLERVLTARENETGYWTDDEGVQELLTEAGVGHLSECELHEPHDRERLLEDGVEQRFDIATTDPDEVVAHQIEQQFDVATTDVDELVADRVQEWYGIDDPDELSALEREGVRDDVEREIALIEDDVDRQFELIEGSIGVDDWENGLMGSIRSFELDGEMTALTEAFRYESASAIDADALRSHVDANRDVMDRWGTLQDYEIETNGAVIVVSGTVRTQSLLF